MGASQLVLAMIEDDFISDDFTLKDPVKSVQAISRNFTQPVELQGGGKITAIELQRVLLTKAREYIEKTEDPVIPEAGSIINAWDLVLNGLENLRLSPDYDIKIDDYELRTRLDWVMKLWLINRRRQAMKADWDHPQLKVLDLQYHRIDSRDGIFYRLVDQGLVETILDPEEMERAVTEPPEDTRAYFRGKMPAKIRFGDQSGQLGGGRIRPGGGFSHDSTFKSPGRRPEQIRAALGPGPDRQGIDRPDGK